MDERERVLRFNFVVVIFFHFQPWFVQMKININEGEHTEIYNSFM